MGHVTPANTPKLRREKWLAILIACVCLIVTGERTAAGMLFLGIATYITLKLVRRVGLTGVVVSLLIFAVVMISLASIINVNVALGDKRNCCKEATVRIS